MNKPPHTPWTLRKFACAVLCLMPLLAAGCGRSDESLESFTKRWHAAANQQDGQAVFSLLDAGSQSALRRDLEVMRGLDASAQQAVLNQLGGVKAESLEELEPGEYFSLLWRRVTDGQRPTMRIEAQDEDSAYMVLALEDNEQRLRIFREAGRWVWQLPRANFAVSPAAARQDAGPGGA